MKEQLVCKTRYEVLDGLRAYAALGIVLMHVLSNCSYTLHGFVFEQFIPSFANLVFLFMVVSGFSMCCGYYYKIIHSQISVAEFYSKRYAKLWPFFALLCVLDLIISPSRNAVYEVFANLTLCFGLLPDSDFSVIGVGWFLGLVFVFYLIFPFFCYLLSDKKRAWFSFVVALVFNYLCTVRFGAGKGNIVYSAVFFFSGGLIFLYREKLGTFVERYRYLVLVAILGLLYVYYAVSSNEQVMLVLFSCIVIYGLRSSEGACILCNSFTRFLGNLSMEIYLSHMVIFRVIEKLGLVKLFDSDLLSYIVTSAGTIIGTVIFSVVVKHFFVYVKRYTQTES